MKNKIFKNTICLLLCIVFLLLFKITYENSFYANAVDKDSIIKVKEYYENKDNFNINVLYPKFTNVKVDAYARLYVDKYIKSFKNRVGKNNEYLNIDYKVSFLKNNMIISLNINDTTNKKIKNKSFIVDISSGKKITNKEFLNKYEINKTLINDKLDKKYSKALNKELKNIKINDTDILINKNKIIITYNNIDYDVKYIPNIEFLIKNNVKEYVYKEIDNEKIETKKYIALTFDDGPAPATNEVIDALSSNNSKATFFVLGSRIKYYKEVLLRESALGNEVGSHTYSHKNLTRLDKKALESEINSTNIIYNEVTNKNITLLRPPYGEINDEVKKAAMLPLITWNVDTEDWLKRDANKISKHVLENVKDGDIVLMHDIYYETAEAVKIMVPILREENYELVTVSELAEIKGKKLENGKVYRSFN